MGLASGWASPESRVRLGRWLLAAAVLASALTLGSLHTPVLAACAALAAIGAALVWYDAEPLAPRPAATVLVLVAIALIAWTGLQIVPMPRGVLAAISGETADVWAHCLSPLREEGPAHAPLSLEPVASRVQILGGITYLVVFIGALRIARRQEGVVFLERVLLVSTVVVAAAALVHPVLGAGKVFGVYAPVETLGYYQVGPLLNMNHLAAYANIGLILAFASVVQRREALPRPIALVIVPLLGATTVWTLSRGGTGTMILGTLLVGTLTFGMRRSKKRFGRAGPLAVLFVAIGGAAVLLLSAFDGTRAKFAQNNLVKIDLAKNSLALIRQFPWFGVGRGAFEATFPKVRVGTGYLVATHPENVISQWTTEWGLPVALLAIAAMVWALRPATALARSRPPVGPWAVLVAVGLHNLVDFNSEVPGVVVALAVCAAMVSGGTGGGEPVPHRGSGWARRPTAVAVSACVVTLIAIIGTVPFSDGELFNEQRSFRDAALDRSLSRDAFHARAREAMLRHPAEPYFPFVGAVRATTVRDESVLPWAGRALERSPVYGRAHLLLARTFFVMNPSQARLEYRTACIQDEGLCARDEALRLVGGYDDAMALVPDGLEGVPTLVHLTEHLDQRLPATVVRLDRELSAREPTALGPVKRAAARALGDVKDAEAWCVDPANPKMIAQHGCIADGLAAASRLRASAPDKCEGHALAAELRVASGEIDAGFDELGHSLEGVAERSPCARRLVSLAVQVGPAARVDQALDRLLKLGCEAPAECVTNLTFAASIEAQRGSQRRAFALTKKAWERAPERDDLLIEVAAKAEAQGFHAEALDAYTKLSERQPNEPRWSEAVARERKAVTRSVFERR